MPGHHLWLLRHAKTVADPPADEEDFDRVLAPRGRRDAGALADRLGADGLGLGMSVGPPQVAFVSPAARTRATAEIVLGGLAAPPRLSHPEDLYGAEPNDVLAHLAALAEDVETAMVIGHNPTMAAIAVGLLAEADTDGRDRIVRRGFPTCALGIYALDIATWFDIDGRTARLLGLFTPPFDEG